MSHSDQKEIEGRLKAKIYDQILTCRALEVVFPLPDKKKEEVQSLSNGLLSEIHLSMEEFKKLNCRLEEVTKRLIKL